MVETAINSEEYNEAVAHDRATMIREAGKQKRNQDNKDSGAQAMGAVSGKMSQQVLDKVFLNINNIIWGLTVMVIPLFGLTLLMSLLLILTLFLKKVFITNLESRGFEVKIGLGTMMYIWGTLLAQLLLTVTAYAIIYALLNPLDFGIEVLGL